MKPSAYETENLEADKVVEARDQVTVTYRGGSVFHIQVDGTDDDEYEVRRGGAQAWGRAEELRAELNPDYSGPPPEAEETNGTSDEEPVTAAKPAKAKTAKSKKAKASEGKGASPDGNKEVMIGHVKGVQRMVPVAVVEDILADLAGRVAVLRGSTEARQLQRRVRATDGRCAPIFLTRENVNDTKETPKLFDGLYTLAAALNLDMEKVAVVILPAKQVTQVQGMIVSMMRSNLSNPEMGGDDELFYRGNR